MSATVLQKDKLDTSSELKESSDPTSRKSLSLETDFVIDDAVLEETTFILSENHTVVDDESFPSPQELIDSIPTAKSLEGILSESSIPSDLASSIKLLEDNPDLSPRLTERDMGYRANAMRAVEEGLINPETDFVIDNTGHVPNVAAGLIKSGFKDVAIVVNPELPEIALTRFSGQLLGEYETLSSKPKEGGNGLFLGVDAHQPYIEDSLENSGRFHDPYEKINLPTAQELKDRGVNRIVITTEGDYGQIDGTSVISPTLDSYIKGMLEEGIEVTKVGLEPAKTNREGEFYFPETPSHSLDFIL